jgi:translocation protein SEC63
MHPDKAKPDPANNITADFINDRWVEMTKAYKALTDEEIRNNYLLYGNPDGKQSTSIGIALPKWMVEENNRWFVVAFYGILLGVVLPYTLGSWWYGTQSRTKEKVLHASAGNLFREWKEDISEDGIVGALSIGDEYKDSIKPDSGSAKVEAKVINSGLLSESAKQKLKSIDDPVRRKTLALLWAYLYRIDLGDLELEKEKYTVAPTALLLNNSFSMITLPFQQLGPLVASYKTAQNLIQAIPPNASPALQLPHFTPEITKKISGANSKTPLTLQKLMSLPPSIRRNLVTLPDAEYNQAMKVAAQIPRVQVEKAFFKVIGDRVVTPSSLVQLVVKARVIPPGTKNIPAMNIKDLEDRDPDEGDIEALQGRKKPKDGGMDNSEQPPLAHAPYFAAEHAPRWHIFLADHKMGRIAVPPFTFTAFDKPAFTSEGKPTFNIITFRCQFQAPPQVANFPFTMYLMCDSYIGFDVKIPITLEVKDVSEAEVVESDDEISEPEEDSLAGQIQAMKTGTSPTGPPKKRKLPKKIQEVESDDESDTEGSVEDTSETDTETEDEG